ncbi:GATA zinc finger domain-containing protein 8-like [Anastrepha obliqua]|uniref:GATA zinc finger domain-containing protein 8-like n=1 Tax=Anastrepha obliqua TaxID=95512 RepID=UPI002409AB97|nr:GATA zinc finger domain-containing protein 8-like [Anastrepha obliqua]
MDMMTVNKNNNNDHNSDDDNNNCGTGANTLGAATADGKITPTHSTTESVTEEAFPVGKAAENMQRNKLTAHGYDAEGDIAAIAAVAADCERLLAAATADTADNTYNNTNNKNNGGSEVIGYVSDETANASNSYDNNDNSNTRQNLYDKVDDDDNDTDLAGTDGADAEVLCNSAALPRAPRSQLDYTASFASYDSHVHQLNHSQRCNSHASLKVLRRQRQQQQLHQRLSAQQNTSSLKLSASSASICSSTTSTCPAYSVGEPLYQSVAFTEYGAVDACAIEALTMEELADESVLRYSFKGYPPELYSPRKEFIYTRPLVEKQGHPLSGIDDGNDDFVALSRDLQADNTTVSHQLQFAFFPVLNIISKKLIGSNLITVSSNWFVQLEDLGFANDICLLSPKLTDLQAKADKLVTLAGKVGHEVNVAKTKALRINHTNKNQVIMDGKEMEFVDSFC